jgi:uncharacterized SAM-binding protein YcdF (DUF218 family)
MGEEAVFILRKTLAVIALPPLGPLILAIAGLALLNRRPRTARLLAWGGVLVLLAACLPAVSGALARAASCDGELDARAAGKAQAIVILGAGVREATEYGGETLGRLTAERVRYGARVARELRLPVLVSGGAIYSERTEADLMADALENEYGLPVRWREALSRNTRENAEKSAALLAAASVRTVVLVVHGLDVCRAQAEFERAGVNVIPAATFIVAESRLSPADFVPSVAALSVSHHALYELLARAARAGGL